MTKSSAKAVKYECVLCGEPCRLIMPDPDIEPEVCPFPPLVKGDVRYHDILPATKARWTKVK